MLNALFRIHGIVTLAAGIVLIGWPQAIPAAVSIQLAPNAYLLCYLLGAVEMSVGVLSYASASLTDAPARRLIGLSFVVMHGLTALLEIYAIWQGGSAGIRPTLYSEYWWPFYLVTTRSFADRLRNARIHECILVVRSGLPGDGAIDVPDLSFRF